MNNRLIDTADCSRLHSIQFGNGDPVVLIHGIGSSVHTWRHLVPALTSQNYRVHALDLLGHGDSAKPASPECYRIDQIYRHFDEWFSSLNLDQPAVLIGHSLGAYIAMTHALGQPDLVTAMILIDPYYSPHQLSLPLRFTFRQPEITATLLRLTPMWAIHTTLSWSFTTPNQLPDELRKRLAMDYKRADPRIVRIAPSASDLMPVIPKIRQPALVIWGCQDLTLLATTFPPLVDALPNGSSHPIWGAGHIPHLTQAEQVNQEVIEFLDQVRYDGLIE